MFITFMNVSFEGSDQMNYMLVITKNMCIPFCRDMTTHALVHVSLVNLKKTRFAYFLNYCTSNIIFTIKPYIIKQLLKGKHHHMMKNCQQYLPMKLTYHHIMENIDH